MYNLEYISLGALKLDIYERLPLPIRGWVRHSVFFTLLTSAVSLFVLLLIPDDYLYNLRLEGGFFEPTKGIVYWLFGIGFWLYPHLIVLNAFNLLLTMALLTFTLGTLRGGSPPVQSLIAANGVPAVLSLVSIGVIVGLFVVITIVTLIIWIVIITFIIGLIFAILGGAANQ